MAANCIAVQVSGFRTSGNSFVALVLGDEFSQSALKSILLSERRVTEVIETASFDEALEQLSKRTNVNLAILDVHTSESAKANLTTLRKRFPAIRVVVVSDSSERTCILTALEHGAHGFIPKRLGITEFRRALAMILNGLIYVPSSVSELRPTQHRSPDHQGCEIIQLPVRTLTEPRLTPRQLQVLRLLMEGKSNKEICRALNLGEGTVKIHIAGLFRALDVKSRTGAAVVGAGLLKSSGQWAHSYGLGLGDQRTQRM